MFSTVKKYTDYESELGFCKCSNHGFEHLTFRNFTAGKYYKMFNYKTPTIWLILSIVFVNFSITILSR